MRLAPGETLLPGTAEAVAALLDDPKVAGVIAPLVPQGDHALARAARRYLAAWDGRLLHDQTFYAPATRCALRHVPDTWAPHAGHVGPTWRNADAAPHLADAMARGARIVALRDGGIACRIADDLGAWNAHFRAEGAAWTELARRDPRFARFAPDPWARHNVAQIGRRVIEVLQATKRVDPLVWTLHLARESSFTSGERRGRAQRKQR